jgi:hypothetical protein
MDKNSKTHGQMPESKKIKNNSREKQVVFSRLPNVRQTSVSAGMKVAQYFYITCLVLSTLYNFINESHETPKYVRRMCHRCHHGMP